MTTPKPEFHNAPGIEGGIDTNRLPWLETPQAPGLQIKPLRASLESGMFSVIIRISKDTVLPQIVHLGATDLMMLSGNLNFPEPPLTASIGPGIWGYIPANAVVKNICATEDCEFLANVHGPLAFVDVDNRMTILTALDVLRLAQVHGVELVPNTLAECLAPRSQASPTPSHQALEMASDPRDLTRSSTQRSSADINPHFVDTRTLSWIVNPGLPDIALKILRVSEETGTTSLLVRHNGVAGPHYHLGAADFLILSGRILYRAGPAEGYGPGVWFFEPAGARHEATQRIGDDEDLIYTANVYGPVQFDDGDGTPIVAVQSWMQYKALAEANGVPLVRNRFDASASLLAWSPLST